MTRNVSEPAGAPEHRSITTTTLAGALTRALAGVFLLSLWGCGTTSVTKVEVRERQDSLLVKGKELEGELKSDTTSVTFEDPCADLREVLRKTGVMPVWIDSVNRRPPLTLSAQVDTTINGIRLRMQYHYPKDVFSFSILNPDSLIRWKVKDSIIHRPYEVQVIPLWIRIGGVLMMAALVVGLVVFLIKK